MWAFAAAQKAIAVGSQSMERLRRSTSCQQMMSLIWVLLMCQYVCLEAVSGTQQNLHAHTVSSAGEEHPVHDKEDEVPIDVEDFQPLKPSDVSDRENSASHFSKSEEEVCSNLEESRCDMQSSLHAAEDDSAEETAKHSGQDIPSPSERKAKYSGWFSAWDQEDDIADAYSDKGQFMSEESAVKVLQKNGDFERFMEMGHVVIVFFYKDSIKSEALQKFLVEYEISAGHLLQYGILLALADCAIYSVGSYCIPEKANKFAYGFREGQEKIAFPLDTLFNNNAIVASALHLDLINAVPILQTSGERRELERRCKGRCDIIFSFQRTLGTYEHRMFLEIAHAYQDNYVFAITTYTAGTLGLSYPHPQESDDVEQRIWVVHCADKTIQQQCVVSHYRRKMLLPELLQFLAALQLPKWHDLDVSPSLDAVITPYDGTSLPWVILIYDSSCKHRVLSLAVDLAQLLHGSVATITLNLDGISDVALGKLGLERGKIVTPALAFLHQEQEKTAFLNDYDDPLEWVNEQLAAIYEKPADKEEMGHQPVQALEELLQDDEVVLGMQKEETFTNVSPLSGPEAYAAAINSNTLTVIAFYFAWDPVSSMLLQHLNDIVPILGLYGSQAVLHRINCFDWPKLCDGLGIAGYPELRIHPKSRQNFTYNGPIHSESLAKTILLYGKAPPLELENQKEVESLISLQPDFHQACHLMQAAAVGIFPTKEDSVAFMEAARNLRSSHLTGRYVSKQAVKEWCSSSKGCVLVSKPDDPLEPRTVLNNHLDNSTLLVTFLRYSTNHVLAPLDFERLATLSAVNGGDDAFTAANQFLILLFIPASSSLPLMHNRMSTQNSQDDIERKSKQKDLDLKNSEDETWAVFSRLAAEFSEPGFVFSWIKGDDPLADKLILAYHLDASNLNLVAVNWKHSIDSEGGEGKEDSEKGGVHIYTCPDLSPQSARPWLLSLKDGSLKPSVMLGENDWEPRLAGFDYIKFMMEDDERDAEDQLMLEMESDLSSHPDHGEESDNLLHIHKDL